MNQHWLQERGFVSLAGSEFLVYQELLALEKRKKEILTSSDWSGLSEIVAIEEKVTRNLQLLQAELRVFLAEAVHVLSLREPSMSAIIEKSPPEIALQLREIQENWKQVVFELHELHLQNTALLESAQNVVEIRLKALSLAVNCREYSRSGERVKPPQGRFSLNWRA